MMDAIELREYKKHEIKKLKKMLMRYEMHDISSIKSQFDKVLRICSESAIADDEMIGDIVRTERMINKISNAFENEGDI